MRITTRLLILFIAITIAFGGYFYLFIHIRNVESQVVQESDLFQRRQTLDAVFEIEKDTQQGIVSDFRIRDDVVGFTRNPNRNWSRQHLDPLLKAYDFHVVQVYDKSGQLLYGNYAPEFSGMDEFRLKPALLDSLAVSQNLDFLVKHRQYTLSVSSGSIHSRADSLGTDPKGFFVIATNWDSDYFSALAASLSYSVSISSVEPKVVDEKMRQYNIKILRPLIDWEGKEIAWLTFYVSNPYLKEMQNLGKQIIFGTGAFILLFLFVHFILIEQWISIPLHMISKALSDNKLDPIVKLSEKKNEFADVAGLIEQFFHQRQSLLHEIEERKRSELKLKAAEQQTLSIFLTSPESIVVTDIKGRVITANAETSRLYRLPLTRYPASIYDFVESSDLPALQALVEDLLAGAEVRNQEIRARNSEGQDFPALISASVIFDASNQPARLIFITRDLSELKALEDRLLHAQKMESLGTLAGGIAHDFNNIMTIIAGYIAVSAAKMGSNTSAQDDLDEALKACLRAKRLISKILTFSRHSESSVQVVQLAAVISDSLPMIRASLPSSISINTEFESHSYCLADPTELQQVLLNLASNAAFAMRKTGGNLSFRLCELAGFELIGIDHSVQLARDYLHLEISDTGIGIEPEDIKRIFDPYYSTKTISEGTGLGLSIVHGIISKSNGFINVHSMPGEGTSFHIYLPIVEPTPVEVQPEADLLKHERNARILFIDDEVALTELFRDALDRMGHTVTVYSDSPMAFEDFRSDPSRYDLVIADITMPKLDGIKLAGAIREISEIPLILYTGYSVYNIREELGEIKVNRVLSKPILPDELRQVVQEVLEESSVVSHSDATTSLHP